MKNRFLTSVLFSFLLICSHHATAQWTSVPYINNSPTTKPVIIGSTPVASTVYDLLNIVDTGTERPVLNIESTNAFGRLGIETGNFLGYLTTVPSLSTGDFVLTAQGTRADQDLIIGQKNPGYRNPLTGLYEYGGKIILSTSVSTGVEKERLVITPNGEVLIPSRVYSGIIPKHDVYLQIGDRMSFYGGNDMYINHNTYYDNITVPNNHVRYTDGGGVLISSKNTGSKDDFDGYFKVQVFEPDDAGTVVTKTDDRVFFINNRGNVSIGEGHTETNGTQKLWIGGNTRVDGVLTVNTSGAMPPTGYNFLMIGNAAIDGIIKTRELIVTSSTSFPDYVFKSDYKLRTLDEVEQHIALKGHLPGIPSEAEVAEKGINMGEMQVKLLEKIEELTLYSIEQQKLIIAMQKRLNALESLNNSK